MEDRLPSSRTRIYPDIEARNGWVTGKNCLPETDQQLMASFALLCGQAPVVLNVAAWNDKPMACSYREGIGETDGKLIFDFHPRRRQFTEHAWWLEVHGVHFGALRFGESYRVRVAVEGDD